MGCPVWSQCKPSCCLCARHNTFALAVISQTMTFKESDPKHFLAWTRSNKCKSIFGLWLWTNHWFAIDSVQNVRRIPFLLFGQARGNVLPTARRVLIVRRSHVQQHTSHLHLGPGHCGAVCQHVCHNVAIQVPDSEQSALLSHHQFGVGRFLDGRLPVDHSQCGRILQVSCALSSAVDHWRLTIEQRCLLHCRFIVA